MKTMPKLTKESEERISSALTAVAARANDGEDPSDAIVKVATDRQFTAGHVRLMVRAFNNGRSIGHIRNNDSLEEKAAAFPLADASEVLERMFPSDVKTPAEIKLASVISDDYGLAPTSWLKRRAQASIPMQKAAAAPAESPYEEDPRRLGKQATAQLHDMRRDLDKVRDEAIHHMYDVVDSIEKVANYFRRVDALPFESVRSGVIASCGRRGAHLMEKVAEHKIVLKRTGRGIHAVDWDKEPYTLIKAALDAADGFITARKSLDDLEKALPEKRAEVLRPFGLSPANVIVGSVWDNQSLTKNAVGLVGLTMAGAVGGTARGLAGKVLPQSREQLVQSKLQELASPAHEDSLRAIRTRAMINEMMTADPIISGYPADDVMEAFNHLSEVAPRAMQHRLMAQTLIRKYLESAAAMDPFDLGQMTDLDSAIAKRDTPEALVGHFGVGQTRELGPPAPKPRGAALQGPPSEPNVWDEILPEPYGSEQSKPSPV